jgi:hypothetical protein
MRRREPVGLNRSIFYCPKRGREFGFQNTNQLSLFFKASGGLSLFAICSMSLSGRLSEDLWRTFRRTFRGLAIAVCLLCAFPRMKCIVFEIKSHEPDTNKIVKTAADNNMILYLQIALFLFQKFRISKKPCCAVWMRC